jgi:hypothetical protein
MALGALLLFILAMNFNPNVTTLAEKIRSRRRGLSKLMLSGKLYHKHGLLLFFSCMRHHSQMSSSIHHE